MTHMLIAISCLYAFYLGFALCIGPYRQWVAGKFSLTNKLLFMPVIIGFGLVDVLLNYTVCLLVFGLPAKHDYTISARFETYRTKETGYKRSVAEWVCNLLSEIDTSGRHC